ncbi:MAG: hypothetical protein K8R36_13930 [Planctomycetales bacterium]|nr:hypothetical protein [Planctomycetales bacterium]
MIAPASGYSSEIQGHLLVGELQYPLARLGPEAIGLRSPLTLSPSNAEIVLTIDGCVNRMRVFLPEGSSASSPFIPYRKLDEPS